MSSTGWIFIVASAVLNIIAVLALERSGGCTKPLWTGLVVVTIVPCQFLLGHVMHNEKAHAALPLALLVAVVVGGFALIKVITGTSLSWQQWVALVLILGGAVMFNLVRDPDQNPDHAQGTRDAR